MSGRKDKALAQAYTIGFPLADRRQTIVETISAVMKRIAHGRVVGSDLSDVRIGRFHLGLGVKDNKSQAVASAARYVAANASKGEEVPPNAASGSQRSPALSPITYYAQALHSLEKPCAFIGQASRTGKPARSRTTGADQGQSKEGLATGTMATSNGDRVTDQKGWTLQ